MPADRSVPRERLTLAIRAAVDGDALHRGIAAALGLPPDEVRALTGDGEPAVRCEVRRWPRGFALQLDLFIDAARVPVPPCAAFAVRLAAALGSDVAHHDGSGNPYGYVLARPDGRRFGVEEIDARDAWLILDEDEGRMTGMPPLP